MNRLILILFLSLASTHFLRADELVSIDLTDGLITVKQNGALKSFRLKPFTDFTINGQKATGAQLKSGMQVTITPSDPQTASRVAARGNFLAAAATPAPGQPRSSPSPFFTNRPDPQAVRRLTIKALIDGDDKFIVQDGKVYIIHGGWQKPTNISINGIPWKPQWTENDSDAFTALNLAPFKGATIAMKKISGRGDALLLERPSEANSQKLIIHFNDPVGGANEYEIRLDWK